MILSRVEITVAIVVAAVFVVAVITACRLALKTQAYNKRLFVDLLIALKERDQARAELLNHTKTDG